MQFESFSAFLDMGGYGFYVWLSFGVSTALLLILIVNSVLGHKKVIRNIAVRQQREEKLRQVRNQQKIVADNVKQQSDTTTSNEASQ